VIFPNVNSSVLGDYVHWLKVFSGLILLFGFFMIAFTKKKQGLHDLIAEILVIKEK
jgi:uncharacterized RDD family membrane protein YckC